MMLHHLQAKESDLLITRNKGKCEIAVLYLIKINMHIIIFSGAVFVCMSVYIVCMYICLVFVCVPERKSPCNLAQNRKHAALFHVFSQHAFAISRLIYCTIPLSTTKH